MSGQNFENLKRPQVESSAEGSAFEAEGLRIGQTILEIDGRSTEGMSHAQIAHSISKSFANPMSNEMVLTVTDGDKATIDVCSAESPTGD
ncbi:unnamed protein product [Notodromas monacha]|uniref:PDZ domain-containing protein n=1 Tax=Notodromas monacha TaxID=399045 RepID=A0A7R9BFV5_9CRUS|nr:unnamed protein product [Notodromas monacha]CAG0914507.1 unnamed protein product [Notodromas monacha]